MIIDKSLRIIGHKRTQGLYTASWPIVKQYRVLDCEDVYDRDDYFKVNVDAGPMYSEFIRPDEVVKQRALKRARLQAEAIVREIDAYKQMKVWRAKLLHASREFEFVFQPYRVRLCRKYGGYWRGIFAAKREQEAWHQRVDQHNTRVNTFLSWLVGIGPPLLAKVVLMEINKKNYMHEQIRVVERVEHLHRTGKLHELIERLQREQEEEAA